MESERIGGIWLVIRTAFGAKSGRSQTCSINSCSLKVGKNSVPRWYNRVGIVVPTSTESSLSTKESFDLVRDTANRGYMYQGVAQSVD